VTKQPAVDCDRAVSDCADEETHKNPIHIQLMSYEGPLSAEQLKRVMARSRAFSTPLSAESRVQL